jgi:signal peptidase I
MDETLDGWDLIFSARVRAIIILAAALFLGFIIYLAIQPPLDFSPIITRGKLEVQSHTWAINCTSITLTIKNTGTGSVSVEKILVYAAGSNVTDVVASNVTYGPAFSETANTLSAGETGTITITQQFSSGIQYVFHVISTSGNSYPYVTTAPSPAIQFYLKMESGSMEPTIHVGDTIKVEQVINGSLIEVGDIIAFQSPHNACETIVHRVVNKEFRDASMDTNYLGLWYFQTKGDANYIPDMWSGEYTWNGMISEELLIGKII